MAHDSLVILLIVIFTGAWLGGFVSVVAGNRSYYPWHGPLYEAGVLPSNGRGPALKTWRRLLGSTPEQDPTAEALRAAARNWFLRAFASIAVGGVCAGLLLLVA